VTLLTLAGRLALRRYSTAPRPPECQGRRPRPRLPTLASQQTTTHTWPPRA